MAITAIQGRLSHVQQSTETHGHMSEGTGRIASLNAWSFRVNNRAAVFKTKSGASLSDGDLVTAAGEDVKGTFQAYALRNDTTGSVHNAPSAITLIFGGLLTVLGLLLMIFLVGFIIAPFGLYYLWRGIKMMSANGALAAAPAQAS